MRAEPAPGTATKRSAEAQAAPPRVGFYCCGPFPGMGGVAGA
ncbi:hypothetical protein HVPorG_04742 [Roseomonas mucosa]|nr:hypothetical protein HVPorG_04742 [Roseomonas mucosa]